MPYMIDSQHCIHKQNTDGSMGDMIEGGCHDTAQQAQDHMAALYAAEADMQKEIKTINLTEIIETIRAAWRGQFNQNRADFYTYVDEVFDSYVIACIEDGGEKHDYQVPYTMDAEMVTFAPQSDWIEVEETYIPVAIFRELTTKVMDILSGIKARLGLQTTPLELNGGVFKALGNSMWMAAFTNNFEDREKEILMSEAIQRYIPRVQKGYIAMPELRYWHIPGSQHGKALWVDSVGESDGPMAVIAIGQFDDTPVGKAAEKHYLDAGPLAYKLSHGFFYPSWARKNYGDYVGYTDFNTFEITTLPAEKRAEANSFTGWNVELGELNMNLPEDKKKDIEARFGAEMIKQIEAFGQSIEERAKTIAETGVQYKDFVDPKPEVEPKDANKEIATVAENQLMTELMGAFEENNKAIDQLTELVTGALSKFSEAKTNFDTATQELQQFLSQTPQGVDSGLQNVATGEGVDEATKNLDERKDKNEKDTFWGFPVAKGGS